MKTTSKKLCALCRARPPIPNSHVVPAWVFKRIIALRDGAAPPTMVEVKDGDAKYSQAQYEESLLCTDCEGRFAVFEGIVASLTSQLDGSFPLLDRLATDTNSSGPYEFAHLPNGEVDALARFAVSVLWRASASEQPSFGRVRFGPTDHERVRRYLLDELPFPRNAALLIELVDESKIPGGSRVNISLEFPKSARMKRSPIHFFATMGLRVKLLFEVDRLGVGFGGCLVRHRVARISYGHESLENQLRLLTSATAKGGLAKADRTKVR